MDVTMTKNHRPDPYNELAVPLEATTELGLGLLIAEDEEGRYEPVAVTSTINEAQGLADHDLRGRMRRLERGDDPSLCPAVYKLWARGIDGRYRLVMEISAL